MTELEERYGLVFLEVLSLRASHQSRCVGEFMASSLPCTSHRDRLRRTRQSWFWFHCARVFNGAGRAGDGSVAYPPTRPSSPRTLSLGVAFDLQSASNGPSHEWNEKNGEAETSPQDVTGATPSNDFGTGVRGGIGYMGLSSAATLLRAIQKFAPLNNNVLPSQGGAVGSTLISSTSASWDHSKPSTSAMINLNATGAPILPSANEINPLVDSYFRYFRQSDLPSWYKTKLTLL